MELFKLFGTVAIDNSRANSAIDETTGKAEKSEGKMSTAFSKMGSAAMKVGKTIATGLAVGSAAIVAVGKMALDGYADFEQLVGGVETLFGAGGQSLEEYAASVGKTVDEVRGEYGQLMQAQSMVMHNAEQAYKTAGMSANEYMETVTSFSAALIQSLDGDTAKAAEKANRAITDMSDNANKMGSDMESIQNAYQGFAKQNFTMLDNLRLGYGGTQAEMQRLLTNAQAISGIEYDISSYADIVDAIHVIQDEMGIAGTTAKEASGTISGSVSAMKASFSNLVAGLGNDQANLDGLINDFIDSAITAFNNILPRIEQILGGIGEVIARVIPIISEQLPGLIQTLLPGLIQGATSLFTGLVSALPTLLQILIEQLPYIITEISSALVSAFPVLLDCVKQLFGQLASFIFGDASAAGDSIGSIFDVLVESFGTLWDSLSAMGEQLLPIFMEIANTVLPMVADALGLILPFLVELVQKILPVVTDVISQIMPFLLQIAQQIFPIIFDLISQLLPVFMQIVDAVLPAITQLISQLLPALMPIVQALMEVFQQLVPPIMQIVQSLLPVLMTLIEAVVAIMKPLIDLVLAIITPLVELIGAILTPIIELIASLVSWLAEKLQPVFEVIATVISTVLNAAFESIMPIVEKVKGFLSSAWAYVSNNIKTVFNVIKTVISTVWNGIKTVVMNVVNGVRDGISTAFNKIKTVISTIMNSVKTTISNIWNGIWNTIKSVVNWILGGIEGMVNGVIGGVNKIIEGINTVVSAAGDLLGLDWSIPTLSTISLPRLEKGGILEKGQVGLLEGNGAEAVVPLDQNEKWIAKVAKDMNNAVGGEGLQQVSDKLDELLALLAEYLPGMASRNLVLDSGVLVGELAPGMDAALGKLAIRNRRGI